MRVCVTQRQGIRYFTRFTEIGERDKLEVELRFEDNDDKTILIDLTQALLDEYSKHPLIGKVTPVSVAETAARQARKPLVIKKSMDVSPAYLDETKNKAQKEKDSMLAKVHEAQYKAAEEAKEKKAKLAAARAERLAAARKVKSEKEQAKKKPVKVEAVEKPAKSTRSIKAKELTKQNKKAAVSKAAPAKAAIKKSPVTAKKTSPAKTTSTARKTPVKVK